MLPTCFPFPYIFKSHFFSSVPPHMGRDTQHSFQNLPSDTQHSFQNLLLFSKPTSLVAVLGQEHADLKYSKVGSVEQKRRSAVVWESENRLVRWDGSNARTSERDFLQRIDEGRGKESPIAEIWLRLGEKISQMQRSDRKFCSGSIERNRSAWWKRRRLIVVVLLAILPVIFEKFVYLSNQKFILFSGVKKL